MHQYGGVGVSLFWGGVTHKRHISDDQCLFRAFGHATGVESVREALTAASEIDVKYLTLYAFSTENWNRPKDEVDGLMDLLVQTISSEIESLNKNDVRLKTIGDTDQLPKECRAELLNAIDKTSGNQGTTLILALNYSSKNEIKNAIKVIAEKSVHSVIFNQ